MHTIRHSKRANLVAVYTLPHPFSRTLISMFERARALPRSHRDYQMTTFRIAIGFTAGSHDATNKASPFALRKPFLLYVDVN